MLYLEAAGKRVAQRASARFSEHVEAIRAGTIFARDSRQYQRWAARQKQRATKSLTGAALEAAIARIGDQFPGHVIHG
jgi:hypothetical protein